MIENEPVVARGEGEEGERKKIKIQGEEGLRDVCGNRKKGGGRGERKREREDPKVGEKRSTRLKAANDDSVRTLHSFNLGARSLRTGRGKGTCYGFPPRI
jgi:hypothetical protein